MFFIAFTFIFGGLLVEGFYQPRIKITKSRRVWVSYNSEDTRIHKKIMEL